MPRVQRDAYQKHNSVQKFPLVRIEGKFVADNKDYIQFSCVIKGLANPRVEFFPHSVCWYKEGNNYIEVHKWFAEKKGLV